MRSYLFVAFLFLFQDDKVRQQYEEKRLQAPQTAKGQYDLGRWCDQKKLKEEALKAYERSIEIDPDFEPARKALGHKKVLGRWTSEKNYADTSWWAHPKVDQKKVDDAIVKGVNYLLNQVGKFPEIGHPHGHRLRAEELALLTCLEAGWDRKDPRLQQLINKVLSNPVDFTYHVALKAMCLATLDPMKYQQYLAHCAQFLVDNQASNGQWGYGKTVPMMPQPGQYPTTANGPIPDISTGVEGSRPDPKAPQPKQVVIKKGQNVGGSNGDNSNTQYAALGLRACLSGLVVVPKETIEQAEQWWEKDQHSDGGWGYSAGTGGMGGGGAEPSWGSMTAGAVGALAIYKYYRMRVFGDDVDWKNAPSIKKGADWMGKNLDFNKNPHHPMINAWQYYWYYAIERAGRLLETEHFGSHEWYPEGANEFLKRQQPDGSWQKEEWGGGGQFIPKDSLLPGVITETCFAILFLRRATPKLDETLIKTGGFIPAGGK